MRQQFPELRIGDIAKKLGEKWGLCDTDKRKEYEVTANEQKEEYKNKMEAYGKLENSLRNRDFRVILVISGLDRCHLDHLGGQKGIFMSFSPFL